MLAVITDENVAKLWAEEIARRLQARLFIVTPGEKHKTRKTKEWLEDQLLAHGFGRKSTFVGVGGGVICDLVGFLASTYQRGVDLILYPTTLLAMVDASIGGKNGVNTAHGKNMIGTLWHPKEVVLDLKFLTTLPEEEMQNGLVEMMKAGLIADAAFFERVDSSLASIQRSISIKRQVIEENRDFLNFGHTVGHALELLSGYTLSHGQAVAQGMIVEAHMAMQLGLLPEDDYKEIFLKMKPFTRPFEAPIAEMLEVMKMDKKSVQQEAHFVLLKAIGKVHGLCSVPQEVIGNALRSH